MEEKVIKNSLYIENEFSNSTNKEVVVHDIKLEILDDYRTCDSDEQGESSNDIKMERCEKDVNCIQFGTDLIESQEVLESNFTTSANEESFHVKIKNGDEECKAPLVKDKVLQCAECDQSFQHEMSLLHHLESHFDREVNECIQCGHHLIKSLFSRALTFKCFNCQNKCILCGKLFVNKYNLKNHIELHIKERHFVCPRCSKTYIIKHKVMNCLRTHAKERPFVCSICAKAYAETHVLKKRLRTVIPLECRHCGLVFEVLSALKKHISTHTVERLYACQQCDRTFAQEQEMKRHIHSSHSKRRPFPCMHCSRAFLTPYDLKTHVRVHTGERPFECTQCDKKFTQSGALNYHIRTHTEQQLFACPMCTKTYIVQSSLKKHIRVHANQLPL